MKPRHQPPGGGSPQGPAPDRLREGRGAVARRRVEEAHVGVVVRRGAGPTHLLGAVARLELGLPARAEDELALRPGLLERAEEASRLVVQGDIAVGPVDRAVGVARPVQVLPVVGRSRKRLDHDGVDVVDVDLQRVHDGRSRLAARPPCGRELAGDGRRQDEGAELVVGVPSHAVREIGLARPLSFREIGVEVDRVDGAGVDDGHTVTDLGEVRTGRSVRCRHEAGGHDARQRDAEQVHHELVMHCIASWQGV